jgi:hypothetical protein
MPDDVQPQEFDKEVVSPQAPEEVPEETPESETPDETTEESPQEKALRERAEALDKRERDLKAQAGRIRKEQEREQILLDLGDQVAAQNKSQAALIKALTSGETETLPAELTAISQETAQTSSQRKFQTQYNSLWADLQEAVKDESGEPLIDLFNAPELNDVRAMWNEGQSNADLATLNSAIMATYKIVRQKERELARQRSESAKKGLQREARSQGVLDQDAPSGRMSQANYRTVEAIEEAYHAGTIDSEEMAKQLTRLANQPLRIS